MPFPAGVTLCEVTLPASAVWQGGTSTIQLTLTPTRSVVHRKSGEPLVAITSSSTGPSGPGVTMLAPHGDQHGYRDAAGNSISGWEYEVLATYRDASNVPQTLRKQVRIPSGTTSLNVLTAIDYEVISELPEGLLTSSAAAAQAVNPATPLGAALSATVVDLIQSETPALVTEQINETVPDLVAAATPVRQATLLTVSGAHRARMNNLGGLTNGTDTACMSRVSNVAPYHLTEVTVGYSNVYSSSSRETPGPNDITVRAAIEYNSVFFPLFLNGQRDLVIQPGAFVEFDPVFANIPKGATYFVRTLVTVTAGGKWPYGTFQGVASPLGDGVEQGTSVTDKTTSGTVATSNNYAYGPTSVRARRLDGTIDIVAIGDSISFGSGDSQDRGMIVRAVDNQHPLRNIGFPGSQASEFTAQYAKLRLKIAGGATHWIMLYGTNDLSGGKTAAQLIAALTASYQLGATLGAEVWAGTLPPRTTSTDAWATTANQTVAATEANRVAVNDWIRTTPAPLAGYFDTADALETSRNSGIWKAGYTTDGVHPDGEGSAAGALAIDISQFS